MLNTSATLAWATHPMLRLLPTARKVGAVIVTRDVDFANIRNYPPHEFSGIIVLTMPDDAVAKTIVNLLQRFLIRRNLRPSCPAISSSSKPAAYASALRSNDHEYYVDGLPRVAFADSSNLG